MHFRSQTNDSSTTKEQQLWQLPSEYEGTLEDAIQAGKWVMALPVCFSSLQEKDILGRVANIPLVSSTYDMAATAYKSTKSYPYVKSLWDAAEEGIKIITKAAVYSAQPILTKLEPQIGIASEYAHKSLDILEQLPVLQMTADKVASNTKEMVSAKMASAKDSIASRLSGVVSLTKEAVQSSMAIPKSVIHHSLTTVAATGVGRMAVGGAEALLLISEKLVDNYIPISDEELKILKDAHAEAFEQWLKNRPEEEEDEDLIPDEEAIILPGPEWVEPGYLERLGTLLWKLRSRSYHHSIGRIKQFSIQDYLFRLQQKVYWLRSKLRSKFSILNQEVSSTLVWLDPSKPIPGPKADNKVEIQTRTMFHSMTQLLQIAGQTLLSSIQGFPSSLQDSVRQIHQSIGELHTTFQKLPSTLLAQNHETIITVREYMDELVHFIAFDTPLYWMLSEFVVLYWPFVNQETDEDYANTAKPPKNYTTETESEESEEDS